MDAIDVTIEALERRDNRDIRNFGLGSTEGAHKLISRHFEAYIGLFQQAKDQASGLRGRRRELLNLDTEVLTLVSLESAISSFDGLRHHRNDDMDDLSKTLWFIGSRLEGECYGKAFREHMAQEAEQIEKAVKRAAGNLSYRKRLLKGIARQKGFDYAEWTPNEQITAAQWVMEVLTRGPLFTFDEDQQFTMTTEALSEVEGIMADLVLRKPRCLPQTGEVQPWEGPYLHLEGLRYSMVRTHMKAVRKFVEREFRAGSMGPTLDALNHAQSVLWRINEPMLDLVRWSFQSDLGRAVGLPAKNPLEVPEVTEGLDEAARAKLFKERREKKTANRGFIGERIILEQALAMAEELKGQPFWTPMNLDYRGRVYALPQLNFQGADHIRALFQFWEGQVLTEEGLYWLKVHVANCGAFNKIDKAPFDARVKWVDENMANITAVAYAPKANSGHWINADSPFMYVAACKALVAAQEGAPCHIPVSFDGTCSGLQHLCAMTRAPEGSLVNLTPSEKPNDVYQVVADRVVERLTNDSDNPDLAQAWIKYGITRSLVKRNVMTYSYSSKARGMTDQVLEDTVRPMSFKVLTGELPEHPLGQDWMEVTGKDGVKRVSRHWYLANYLAKNTYAAIEEVVEGPAKAMAFLRDIAGAYAHEGKPTIWHTPLGFPVMMRYPNLTTKRIELFLHDKAIRFQPRCAVEAPGIKKDKSKNGIAPSFVHSLDACHLMMVLLKCKQEGINSVALVHDSFGCLPNDCGRFRAIIKQTFRDLYTENDVLAQIRTEAEERLDNPQLPEVPEKGSLNMDEIMQADYCFA